MCDPISATATRVARPCRRSLPESPYRGPGKPPTATATAVTPQPVAERRVCSVLFCDLVGFTPLSRVARPEEVRELLSEYFDVARTVIGRYGGVVEKFIGDAVMAVWGTPVATEGDAERAVRAALDLVAAVAALGARLGAPGLAARAGVVTGEVAVTRRRDRRGHGRRRRGEHRGPGAGGRRARAGAGSTTRPGGWPRPAVGFADAGEHVLKGKAEPVPAVAGRPGAVRRRRVAAGRRAGGAVRRPRRRAAAGQGAVPRVRRAARRRAWSS